MDPSEFGLLTTLVASLVAAFAGGLCMRALRLPPLLGYILAGIAIGPSTPGFNANIEVAEELAQVGVALLLFNIGLHFSFKDLLSVRKLVLPGASVQVVGTTLCGAFFASTYLGQSIAGSIVLGLTLAVSSTAILTRLMEEKQQLDALPGRIALGWCVAQDLIVILALVFLPAITSVNEGNGTHIFLAFGQTLLQITGFGAIMLIGGRRFIPMILKYVAQRGSRELFTLAVIVIALGIAYGSAKIFGVSAAMGAFFAGVVIGESDLNHHAASEAMSMQQVFTIIFFVSIGMLFDPSVLLHAPVEILCCLGILILCTGLIPTAFLLAMGVPLQNAVLVGAGFSQIGEVSFVLNEIGLKMNLYGQAQHDIVMGVALLSIMLNPALVRLGGVLAKKIYERPMLLRWLDRRAAKHKYPSSQPPLSGHTILVGHGRVGGVIGKALHEHEIPFVIIESDHARAERLRAEGNKVIFGDAGRDAVCAATHPELARLLIVAVPDAYFARQTIRAMRRLNPNLDIVVRTHSDEETRLMNKMGVGLAVMGEREIGLGMSAYALFRLGIDTEHTRSTLNSLREKAYGLDRPAAKPVP